MNNKRYRRDFFTIDTIDDGLSTDINKSISSLCKGSLAFFVIVRKHPLVYKAKQSDQRTGMNPEQFHRKEHIKMHRIAFSKICRIEFQYRNYFQECSIVFMRKCLSLITHYDQCSQHIITKYSPHSQVIIYSGSPLNSIQLYI